MLRGLQIRGVGPSAELDFEFGPRLNLFTGDNGVGKSFVLDVVWWALAHCWAGIPAKPTSGAASIAARIDDGTSRGRWDAHYSYPQQRWLDKRLLLPTPKEPVIYASVDGFRVFDPYRNVSREHSAPEPDPTKTFDAFRFSVADVWNGLEYQGKPVCNGLIRDWATWKRAEEAANRSHAHAIGRPDEQGPFALLRQVLMKLSDPNEPLTPGPVRPVFVDDTRDIPTLESPWGGEPIPVMLASAGVQRILMLSYLLTWVWYEHKRVATIRQLEPASQMYVIIDELEMHLHPRWQRRIGPALLSIARALDTQMHIQFFATTHSPLVLASLETHVSQGDRLFNFDVSRGHVDLEELAWVKHGDASGWLDSDAFETSPYSIEAERAIGWAEDFMSGRLDDIPNEYRNHAALTRHLADVLAASDPFWVSWYASRKAP